MALNRNSDRGNIGFQECVLALENGKMIADLPNPSSRYPHQRMFVLDINNYAFVVPYLLGEDEVFLKTVFPSRKYTAIYLKEKSND